MQAKSLVVLTFLLFSISMRLAGTQKVLYTFTGGLDGGQPMAGVIFDRAGNLYGVTQYGGAYNQGTVFELTPSPDGTWTETVLYSFTGGSDGGIPQGGLATDGVNFYGTTAYGGTDNDSCGTFFVVWQNEGVHFEVLHTFNDLTGDGCQPESDVSVGGYWTYGTTAYGGRRNGEPGTVFAYSQGDYEAWPCPGNAAWYPTGLSLFGNSIYGTAYLGGKQGQGNVFELSSSRIRAKHVFTSKSEEKQGDNPVGNLATQVNGNGVRIMYGANGGGGSGNQGTVYQLPEVKNEDRWAISVLHSFSGSDGAYPGAGVVLDAAGNLYGTTMQGGTGNSGTVFKLTPGAKNKWTETLLYNFTGAADGGNPAGSLVLDSAGNIYGTTSQGGAYNQGVVYEVTP